MGIHCTISLLFASDWAAAVRSRKAFFQDKNKHEERSHEINSR